MKYKSDLKVRYGDNIIDEIENMLAKEVANSVNKSILNTIIDMIPPGKKYLYSLIENEKDNEKQVLLLMEKYSILEEDLENLEIVQSKIREYNIDFILKNK